MIWWWIKRKWAMMSDVFACDNKQRFIRNYLTALSCNHSNYQLPSSSSHTTHQIRLIFVWKSKVFKTQINSIVYCFAFAYWNYLSSLTLKKLRIFFFLSFIHEMKWHFTFHSAADHDDGDDVSGGENYIHYVIN